MRDVVDARAVKRSKHRKVRRGGGGGKVKYGVLGFLTTLCLLFWNARGASNKEVVLKDLMDKEGVVYGGISESKTYQDITNLSDKRWRWDAGHEIPPTITHPRPNRGMGALVDKTKCKASLIKVGEYTMWHRIELNNTGENPALITGNGYFPRASDKKKHEEANKELLDSLTLFKQQGHHVVFGGDLNSHVGLGGDEVDNAGRMLLDTIKRADMQLVNGLVGIADQGPTREQVREDGLQSSTIDYIAVSRSLVPLIESMSIVSDQMGSDHHPMVLRIKDLDTVRPPPASIREVWKVDNIPSPLPGLARRGDWSWVDPCQARFTTWLAETSGSILAHESVNTDDSRIADVLDWSFQQALDELASTHLGTKVVGHRACPYVDKAMAVVINQKKVAESLMKSVLNNPGASDQDKIDSRRQFLRLSRAVTSFAAKRKTLAELKLFREIEDNDRDSKKFWSKFNTLRGAARAGKAPPPVVADEAGDTVNDPLKVLRIWRDFSSQMACSDLTDTQEEGIYDDEYKVNIEKYLDFLHQFKDNQQELDAPITDKEVFKGIRRLQMGKQPGEDNILTDIVKTAADAVNNNRLRGDNTVVTAISLLFNYVLDREVWPARWGTGVVSPLHKDSSRLEPSNYRPITLLSVMGKLFGSILDKRLSRFTERANALCDEQGGFRPHRGTPDQVLILREILLSRGQSKLPTYAMFIDVKKAYDTVWREQAYVRMHEKGIKGKLWRQLQVMHGDLTRRVRHPLGLSDPFPIERGVAQGAVESPWVYACFIDPLAQALKDAGLGVLIAGRRVPILLYADDMVLLAGSVSELEKMSAIVSEFARKNRFQFNGKKSGVMAFNVSKDERERVAGVNWTLFGQKVKVVNEYVYLGTTLTTNPTSWTRHLLSAIKTAKRKTADLLWLSRRDRGIRPRTAIALWRSMVRPVLEYASEVWAGQVPKYAMEAAEQIQMSFTRAVVGLHGNGSGVSNEVLRAETGTEPLAARWDKLQLGYWKRTFGTDPNRLLRIIAVDRLRARRGDTGGRVKGWIPAAETNFSKHGLDQFFRNPDKTIPYFCDDWRKLTYDAVDARTDSIRMEAMSKQTSTACYALVKSWTVNPVHYCARNSELGKLGMMVHEPYLDDRTDFTGTRLKLLCRTNSIPLMHRVGREVTPPWPKHLRTCFMCSSTTETEDVYHFVMTCPSYEPHRRKLFTRVARISTGFATASPAVQFLALLGQRTGSPTVDRKIDYCMKRYLRKAWNIRTPLTDRINNVFSTTYSVYNLYCMKTMRKGRGVTRTTRPSSLV